MSEEEGVGGVPARLREELAEVLVELALEHPSLRPRICRILEEEPGRREDIDRRLRALDGIRAELERLQGERLPAFRELEDLEREAQSFDRESDRQDLGSLLLHLANGWKPPEDVARAGWREVGLLLLRGEMASLSEAETRLLARALLSIGVRGQKPGLALGFQRPGGRGGATSSDRLRTATRRHLAALRVRDLRADGSTREDAEHEAGELLGMSRENARDAYDEYRGGRYAGWPEFHEDMRTAMEKMLRRNDPTGS